MAPANATHPVQADGSARTSVEVADGLGCSAVACEVCVIGSSSPRCRPRPGGAGPAPDAPRAVLGSVAESRTAGIVRSG
ncbi:hypothetical protein GCM10009869_09180 [Amnibacterium kyonggiense]